MRSNRRLSALAVAIAAVPVLAGVLPAVAGAQSARDYLLGRPRASLTLFVGAARPNASDGVFAFADSLLTLGPNDYTALNVGGQLGIPLSQRLELQMAVSSAARRVQSEYRDFVDNTDLPIEQVTRLRRTPLSLGVRFNITPAGRSISRLAWVPARIVPYVAAGGGAMHYRFRQEGDFVDFRSANQEVFRATLEAKGWAPLAYAATGLTWAVVPAVALNTELRYDHARTPLRGDFTGFDKTTLSGVGLSTGLQLRF